MACEEKDGREVRSTFNTQALRVRESKSLISDEEFLWDTSITHATLMNVGSRRQVLWGFAFQGNLFLS